LVRVINSKLSDSFVTTVDSVMMDSVLDIIWIFCFIKIQNTFLCLVQCMKSLTTILQILVSQWSGSVVVVLIFQEKLTCQFSTFERLKLETKQSFVVVILFEHEKMSPLAKCLVGSWLRR